MKRAFTGWHMLAVMLTMFGTIIAVNLVMARFAIGTFGGTVVDNSYVASQRYNDWLAKARTQEALGWTFDSTIDGERRVLITATPLKGRVTAVASHPLGRTPVQQLAFEQIAPGRWLSTHRLPPGRWLLRIRLSDGTNTALYSDEVPA